MNLGLPRSRDRSVPRATPAEVLPAPFPDEALDKFERQLAIRKRPEGGVRRDPELDNDDVRARRLGSPRAQGWVRQFAATAVGSWLLARLMPTLDRATFRVTGHRLTLTAIVSGLPVVRLTTTGARTAMPHAVSVIGFSTPQGLIVATGNFGRPSEPAWSANLRRNPRAILVQGRLAQAVVAHELTGDARATAWRQCLDIYPGGAAYARRASPRAIALFVLDPEL